MKKPKTMGKLNGIIANLKGSVGNLTFVRLGGETIVKEKISKKSGSAAYSKGQLRQQVLFAHLSKVFKAFDGKLRPSFENKPANMSDFNEFMSANINLVPVYMTKGEVRNGGCVVAGYQITRGSLPSIVHTMNGSGHAVTDIALGALAIDARTTLKQFSQAVVALNDNYRHGDQISCFVATQHQNAETGLPFVTVKAHEVTLDVYDGESLLGSVMPLEVAANVDGFMGTTLAINGAIAWVHSRKSGGSVKVSSQHLMVKNPLLAQYQTDEALQAAMTSYGRLKDEPFLTPNASDGTTAATTPDAGSQGGTTGGSTTNPPSGNQGGTTGNTGGQGGSTTPPAGGSGDEEE